MKKITFLLPIFLLLLLAFPALGASSQCYTFETGIPFIANPGECLSSSSLAQLILNFINISRNIAAILAFAMIVWAGFEYALSSGNVNQQKDAQERIVNAVIGLVLLFALWLILNTINPDILKIENLELQPVNLNYNPINNNHNSGQIPPDLNITLAKGMLSVSSAVNNDYLVNQLATKINALTTTYSWRVTDACIEGFNPNKDFPCKTTCLPSEPDCLTRSVNDAHYYGLAVDLTTNNDPNNKNLVPLAREICNKGLDVLVESDHLHVTLSKKDFQALGITNSILGISPGTNEKWSMGQWYTQGHCNN